MSKKKPASKRPTDPRLDRIHRLFDDLVGEGSGPASLNVVVTAILENAIDWGNNVDIERTKQIFSLLFADMISGVPEVDFCDDEKRRDAIMKIVDAEHCQMCVCCRTNKSRAA